MNTMSFEFGKIILKLKDPRDWMAGASITGKVVEVTPGTFEMTLSTHNLQRIGRIFTGDKKPVITGGERFLNDIKAKLDEYKRRRNAVQEVLSKQSYPVPPNGGKFLPYAHQTKIIGTALVNPYAAIFADCGLGKSGSLARTVELEIDAGRISSGKVLVTAPLSVLHTSWADDIAKFTKLRTAMLWTPATNKQRLGEERIGLGSHGDKPEGAINTKTKSGTKFLNKKTGQISDLVTALDSPNDWLKLRASWRVAVLVDGQEIPFGDIVGRSAQTENTREQFISEQLARKDVDIFLINHDGVRIYEYLLKAHDFEWVIVDESTKIKSPDSKVYRAHVGISWNCKRRNILSGTPNPNGFMDLWSQFYFLDRGMTLEPSLKDFRNEYFVPEVVGYVNTPGGRKQAINYKLRSEEKKDALIQRVRSVGIYLEQRDCLDMPARTDMRRAIYMTPEQEASYDRMAIDLVAELKNEHSGKTVKADAVNVLAKIMKLRQITSGFLSGRDGETVHLQNNPKLEDLDELIDELGTKKLVIACQFRSEIEQLVNRYRRLNAKAIYGNVPVEERARIIRDFQETENTRCVILQPQAAAHGITLTAASHLVFTSLDYNFEYYYQTAKRIERLGQKQPIFIIHSLARYRDGSSTIDEDLLEILITKKHDRDALFSPADIGEVAQQLTQNLIRKVEDRHGKQ